MKNAFRRVTAILFLISAPTFRHTPTSRREWLRHSSARASSPLLASSHNSFSFHSLTPRHPIVRHCGKALALLKNVAKDKTETEKEAIMLTPQLPETIALRQCHRCGTELRERDKFCRRCGVSQPLSTDCATKLFSDSGAMHQSFSGSLVTAVTTGLAQRTTALPANRWTRRLASALVAVPLWLMIVLLSPLEAIAAAKAISNQN